MSFCRVVLVDPALSHLDRVFTYSIPDEVNVRVGSLVRAPFRGRSRLALVVDVLEEPDIERPIPIKGLVGPGLDEHAVDLGRWVAQRYLATLGEALGAMLPQRVASEETQQSGRHEIAFEPRPLALERYLNGEEMSRALRSGGGGFVWRPLANAHRAEGIVSMVEEASRRGGVLVLVPEIRIGGEVQRALVDAFGDAIANLGSDRSARDRYRDWLELRRGAKRIAMGGRSAIFAPVADLAMVLIDDEGHQSYKEGRAPRYHARTVAAERARRSGATLVLVGVPPSVDSRAATARGPYTLVAPSRNEERRDRPPVSVVEPASLVPSGPTVTAAKAEIGAGRRVVLISHRGAGMSALVERVARIVQPKRIAQLDASTSSRDVLRAARSSDLICATPFIAKDLTMTDVGLIAFVDVDAALSQTEYRAAEDAFATWWRAARWATRGRIVVETSQPDHSAIVALTRWDPDVLYRAEAARRRELGYPPFAALARIDVPSERASEVAREVAEAGLESLGPVETEGHTVVVARARRREQLLERLAPMAARWRAADEPMRVDVDPWEVLVPKWRS